MLKYCSGHHRHHHYHFVASSNWRLVAVDLKVFCILSWEQLHGLAVYCFDSSNSFTTISLFLLFLITFFSLSSFFCYFCYIHLIGKFVLLFFTTFFSLTSLYYHFYYICLIDKFLVPCLIHLILWQVYFFFLPVSLHLSQWFTRFDMNVILHQMQCRWAFADRSPTFCMVFVVSKQISCLYFPVPLGQLLQITFSPDLPPLSFFSLLELPCIC